MPSNVIAVDSAGAVMGGARKYLDEMRQYLARTSRPGVYLLGEDRSLTASWLVRRELSTLRAPLRIALNNVSFLSRSTTNVTLLRNALHFAARSELATLGYTLPRTLLVQSQIVRAAANRSDLIVVPCNAMANRVSRCEPKLAARIVVRMHPVTQSKWAAGRAAGARSILVPVLNAPYKRLDLHIASLLRAIYAMPAPHIQIRVTAERSDFGPELAADRHVDFLGRQGRALLESEWAAAGAIYFPTQIESFGYPLAEARANGVPVIALGTEQNREIAGGALCGYEADNLESLRDAVQRAFNMRLEPDGEVFDPDAYFSWLFNAAG